MLFNSSISNRKTGLDFITVGRAGIDFYARQENKAFSEISSYDIGVGGSPANIAVGLSRLGNKVGIITKLSRDGLENFILSYFKKNRIDLKGIAYDPTAKLSLAITEIKPKKGKVVFYRHNPADLKLSPDDIDENYIKQSKAVILTGTALAEEPSRSAIKKIIQICRRNEVKIIFDLDYRPFNWKSQADTKKNYEEVCSQSDLIIANLEEFKLIKKDLDWKTAREKDFNKWLQQKTSLVVLKNGAQGAKVFSSKLFREAGETISEKGFLMKPFKVDSKKPFGAGDAFLATFLSRILSGANLSECLKWASAAAAIVVAQHTCSEAMPNQEEIISFIEKNHINFK